MIDIVDLSSDSDDETLAVKKLQIKASEQQRTARKSTTPVSAAAQPARNNVQTNNAQPNTRRQTALANRDTRNLRNSNQHFMENFNPDTSLRERRKITRKYVQSIQANAPTRKARDALYDENGIHIASGIDMCDCLKTSCSGCFFPCPKCKSTKCGIECRVNRKFTYEQLEYQGCDIEVKNPLLQ